MSGPFKPTDAASVVDLDVRFHGAISIADGLARGVARASSSPGAHATDSCDTFCEPQCGNTNDCTHGCPVTGGCPPQTASGCPATEGGDTCSCPPTEAPCTIGCATEFGSATCDVCLQTVEGQTCIGCS